eukprot:scaffold69076_cov30-Tisochrysis_lutea.AAC.4
MRSKRIKSEQVQHSTTIILSTMNLDPQSAMASRQSDSQRKSKDGLRGDGRGEKREETVA